VFARGHGRAEAPFDSQSLDLGDIVLPPPGAIEGRVLTPEGDPVPRAPVFLQHKMSESRRTDDLGRFRFPDLEPGSYNLGTQPAGAPNLWRRVDLPVGGRVVADLRFERWRQFVVHVRTEDGAPVAGATATVGTGFRMSQAVTGRDGRATLSVMGTPKLASVEPPALEGDLKYRRPVGTMLEGDEQEATFVLVAEGLVRGRVESPEGAPVTMAQIEVRQGGRQVGYGATGEDDAFEIQVPRDGTFDLVLTGRNDPRPAEESRILRGELTGIRAGATDLVLRARAVEATRTLRVRVLDPDGQPATAHVIASPSTWPFFMQAEGGLAELRGLPAEEVQVYTGSPPVWSWLRPNPVRVVPAGQEVTLRFREATTIVGKVLLPDGSPAAHASVHAYRGREGVADAVADMDGRFGLAFEPDTEGPLRLKARLDPLTDTEYQAVVEGVAPGASSLEIRLAAVK
jgi:hypothetical protein